ncbi:hypothetical protein HJFPF1_07188 [Paramyrothecium foliicola]|nr:hypothetical protein HJFPF1_07188 [Paramyrothecium foliicola]
MAHALQHDSLGTIEGIRREGVIQYLGVKYGTLRHAFSDAEMFMNKGGEKINAKEHGPTAASPPACDFELGLIQHSLAYEPFRSSTTECLNLNITVPNTTEKRLPVFIFLHGAGFAIGAGSWPQYDLARFVKLSTDQNQPVIGITINYRLGAYGFLSSAELTALGCPPNRGLRDQRLAFKWVKAYIAGFGGDHHNVTVVGSSAGGNAALLHLESTEPLFERVATLGAGTPLGLKPLSPQVAEEVYSGVLRALGITTSDSSDRLKGLLAVPPGDLFQRLPPTLPLHPVVEGDIIPHYSSFDRWTADALLSIPGTTWCSSIFIGDCEHDVSILSTMLGPDGTKGFGQKLLAALRETFSDKSGISRILAEYDMSNADSVKADEAGVNFWGDLHFFTPVIQIAKAWPGTAYVHHFNEPNPWSGSSKGKASHLLDVAFLFQNFNEFLSGSQVKTAKQQATDLLTFVWGGVPFPVYAGSRGGARVYGAGGVDEGPVVSSAMEPTLLRTLVVTRVMAAPHIPISDPLTVFETPTPPLALPAANQ